MCMRRVYVPCACDAHANVHEREDEHAHVLCAMHVRMCHAYEPACAVCMCHVHAHVHEPEHAHVHVHGTMAMAKRYILCLEVGGGRGTCGSVCTCGGGCSGIMAGAEDPKKSQCRPKMAPASPYHQGQVTHSMTWMTHPAQSRHRAD